MPLPEPEWPQDYNPGPSKHLHALGVIALTFAQFQGNLDILFLDLAARQNVHSKLAETYYFSLNDDKRLDTITSLASEIAAPNLLSTIKNNVALFKWCKHTRDNLLHAKLRRSISDHTDDFIHLSKKMSRTSIMTGIISISLPKLRMVADITKRGADHCDHIITYLRLNKIPPDELPPVFHAHAYHLPKKVLVPDKLELRHTA